MWGIKKKKIKKNASKKVENLPLGTGTLNQAAEAIKKRKKKQADMMKELNK